MSVTATMVPTPPAEMSMRAARSAVRTLFGVRRPRFRPVQESSAIAGGGGYGLPSPRPTLRISSATIRAGSGK